MRDMESDPMLDALIASMPGKLAESATAVKNLFIISGCPARAAQRRVVELFSPPRVTRELGSWGMTRACPSLTAGSTFDLHADKDGNVYDFLNASDHQRCRDRIRAEKPFMVLGSPPCTWWSALMSLNIPKMDKGEAARREAEAGPPLHFACEIYQYQLDNGGHFLHEHPAGARSWSEDRVQRLLADPRVGSIIGHQCRYGQRAMADDGTMMPVRKATRWLSSAPEVLSRLGRKCLGGHRHQALVSGRAAQAAVCPPQLCRAILRGTEAQRRREGHVLPESVVSELAVLGLSGGGRPRPATPPPFRLARTWRSTTSAMRR